MSNSKAARRKDTADILKDIKKEKRNLNAVSRRNASGTGPVSFGTVSTNMGVSVGFNPNIQIGTGLKSGGDVMMGPIAYNPQERTLASDVLTLTDITGIINPGSSWTIVSSQDSNADNLVTINGAAFSGQILYLQAKNQEITLKTTGNIHTNDNADVVLSEFNSGAGTGGEVATLIYDDRVTGGNWVVVNVGSGGGGSGANVTLSNLTDPTAINEDLNLLNNLITFDTDKDTNIYSSGDDNLQVTVGGNTKLQMSNTQILFAADVTFFSGYSNLILGANTITFTTSTQQITSLADGLKYVVPTGDSHEFTVAGDNQLTIGETAITMTDNLVMSDNDISGIKFLTLNNYATSSSVDGTIYAADVSGVRHVYVRTAGATKDLTDIGTGGGGSGANTSLSNLTSTGESHFVKLGNGTAWTAVQHFNSGIDLNGADIDDVETITFDTNNIQIAGATNGLTYTVPSGDAHYFVVDGVTKLQIGSNYTYSLNTLSPGTPGGSALGSSSLPWAGLWCSSIEGTGPWITSGSLNVGGDVWLGNAAADDIHISGTMDTSIKMGANDVDFATGGTVDFHDFVNGSALSSGGASALPARPTAYFTVKYQGATRYIPYYT